MQNEKWSVKKGKEKCEQIGGHVVERVVLVMEEEMGEIKQVGEHERNRWDS